MKKLILYVVLGLTLISVISYSSLSQLMDSITKVRKPEIPALDKIDKLGQENWTIHLSNDTVYHDVRLVYILGDSILLARGNSKSFFHIKDIKSIIFNGKQWPGVVGFFGGLLSGGVIGGVIANANKPKKNDLMFLELYLECQFSVV